MHPILFQLPIPEFLRNWFSFLPEHLTFYSYGVCIALGALIAYYYALAQAKKMEIDKNKIADLFLYIIVAAFIGGKVFFYFEDPSDFSKLLPTGSGFVFYGSLLFAIPTLIWFLRKNKIPIYPFLDVIAICGAFAQGFGKMGCLMSGCCHGLVCKTGWGITFTNPESSADPLNVPLYPTQIYDIVLLFSILAFLFWLRNRKQFHGQMFLLYVIFYAIGRSITEIFRGDEARGFIIENILSHSQFISIFIIATALYFYFSWRKKYAVSKSIDFE